MEMYQQAKYSIDNVSYNDDIEDAPTGKIELTVTGTLAEALGIAPEKGTQTELLPEELILKKRSFTEIPGENGKSVKVTLHYGVIEIPDDSDNAEGSYKLMVTEGTADILTHPRYKDISDSERAIAQALLSGKTRKDLVNVTYGPDVDFELSETTSGGITLEDAIDMWVQSERGQELIAKIESGIKKYKTFGADWTEVVYKTGLNNALTGLATIKTPPGPQPAINGRNWLYVGAEAEKTKSGKAWKITKRWELSQMNATWDKDLYA